MRGDKAAGFAGLWSPRLKPCLAVLEIGQPLLPIAIREGSRIAGNWHGLAVAAFRLIVIAASVKPARRVGNELPIPL